MENTRPIAAPVDVVWNHLVDIEVLKQCIPGCQRLEETGDDTWDLEMKAKIGPVSATFKGQLAMRDIVPKESYTLSFDGQGGAAGFGKGSAEVRLEAADGGTNLHYTVDARVGGRIAQIGQRLVDGAAHKMASDFFARFEEQVSGGEGDDQSAAGAATPAAAQTRRQPAAGSGSRWLWLAIGIAVLAALYWLSTSDSTIP